MRDSITTFIESKLLLKVNREKTEVAYVSRAKYLGYSFHVMNGKCRYRLHTKTLAKMKAKLKELTSKSSGWGYARLKAKLTQFVNGGMNYFKLADMHNILIETDKWFRHTKFKNLMKCDID